jgi:hypothetical protein
VKPFYPKVAARARMWRNAVVSRLVDGLSIRSRERIMLPRLAQHMVNTGVPIRETQRGV